MSSPTRFSVVTEDDRIVVIDSGTIGPPGSGSGACTCIDDGTVAEDSTFSSQKIMELLYPFSLNSFSIAPTTAELGNTVASVTLSWATNYPPDSVSLNSGIGAVALPATSYVHSGVTITANTSYTLTAIRNGVTKTASATVAFLNRVYWGVHTAQTTDEAIIKAMSSQLSGSRARSVTYDCSGGKFFHLAYPKRLGVATFKINNLTYSDTTLTEVDITNQYGYTETYYVYFCNVIQYGASITLVVS